MNRKLKHHIFKYAGLLAMLISTGLLVFFIAVVTGKGISAIDMKFLTSPSSDFGAKGGILYQAAGSLLIITLTALLTLPLALGTAIAKSEYIRSKRWQQISSLLIYGLNGIPSVIFGIFGLIFFVNFLETGISWAVGAAILSFMILPTVVLSVYSRINSIPDIYRDSAKALGLNNRQMIRKVIVPHATSGAVTGLMIGLARAVGETAPIMFIATAFSGVSFPSSLTEPVMALPTHILALAQQASDPDALQNGWGASLVLICMVMVFSLGGLYFRKRYLKPIN